MQASVKVRMRTIAVSGISVLWLVLHVSAADLNQTQKPLFRFVKYKPSKLLSTTRAFQLPNKKC